MSGFIKNWPVYVARVLADKTLCKWVNRFVWLLFVGITIGAFFPGMNVKGADQVSIASSMITVSAILFGVIGAWLALMKIDAEEQMRELAKNRQDMGPVIMRMGSLSDVITTSCVVLFACLVQVFAYHAFSKIDFMHQYASYLKGGSFSVLILLGLIQIKLILRILWIGLDNFVDLVKLERSLLEKHR